MTPNQAIELLWIAITLGGALLTAVVVHTERSRVRIMLSVKDTRLRRLVLNQPLNSYYVRLTQQLIFAAVGFVVLLGTPSPSQPVATVGSVAVSVGFIAAALLLDAATVRDLLDQEELAKEALKAQETQASMYAKQE